MGGRFEMQKGCIKNHPWEEASLERYSRILRSGVRCPLGVSFGSCKWGY